MTKDQIRKIYLPKRVSLSEAEFSILNRKLVDQFFSAVKLSSVKVLHTFLPIEKQREVNTWLIIDRIRKEFPHIQISVPRINNQMSLIESYYFEGPSQLEKNTWGIMEPKQGIPTPIDKIDTVLVPLLAIDRKGNRVGYGRGFYDKFLTNCGHSMKIGLSLFAPINKVDDATEKDIVLDAAVLPDGFLKFKP
jgi:5-formyltetrahydrofolate cyclo-ligase